MDCFVFSRDWVGDFRVAGSAVGPGHVMRGLLYNLVVRAEPLVALTRVPMTYHYGDDRPWLADEVGSSRQAGKPPPMSMQSSPAVSPVVHGCPRS